MALLSDLSHATYQLKISRRGVYRFGYLNIKSHIISLLTITDQKMKMVGRQISP